MTATDRPPPLRQRDEDERRVAGPGAVEKDKASREKADRKGRSAGEKEAAKQVRREDKRRRDSHRPLTAWERCRARRRDRDRPEARAVRIRGERGRPVKRMTVVAVSLLAASRPGAGRAEDSVRWGPGLKLAAPASDFHIALAGYVQGDGRSFRNWGNGDEAALRSDTTELRRLRIGVEGEWRRLSFEFDVDPQDTGDHLKNAYLDLRVAKALRVRAGHFKVPVSREWLTSAAKIDFVERTMLADRIGPGRDYGVMLHGDVGKRLTYLTGVFEGDGSKSVSRAETTVVGRLVLSPLGGLELGGSFSRADVRADPDVAGGDPQPKGIVGDGPAGFRFYPRHFVNGRRLRLGGDAAYFNGPVALKAEYLEGRERRVGQGSVFGDLPEEVATGWAISGTWLLTGDKKKSTIRPKNPLFNGAGAVEIGVRYESMRFDDTGPSTGFEGAGNRARNIRPVADRVLTAGLSWWPVSWTRLMGNVLVERYEDALLAPEPGRRGNYVTLLGRLQFQLP